jgi:DNA-binding FadR family transcriptional regulator
MLYWKNGMLPPRFSTSAGGMIQAGRGKRLKGSLAQQLAVQILSGELPAGHVFVNEIEYAEQLGISRATLREAFRILAAKGLVNSRPKSGTRVSPKRQWSLLDPDLLAWQFEARPSPEFLRDLFELRMLVEPGAAALAASRRTDAEVDGMRRALESMAAHGLGREAGRLADLNFHNIMLESTRNDMVIALASSIMAAIAWTTIYKQRKRALARDPIPDHRAMAELIRLAQADTEVSLQEPR